MALVPAGSFLMGDSVDGESDAPTNTVFVSGFYMDTNLVSSNLWQQIYQWATTNGYSFDTAGSGTGTNYPVQTINWYDAVRWCNARSQMAGLTPVYYTDTNLTQIYKTNDGAVYANWTVGGYRLPTEAEWEKAARGGSAGQRFPWGNFISESQANYYGDPYTNGSGYNYDSGPAGNNQAFNSGGGLLATFTSPVGYFAPNGYGLNDMAGNVFEWCWDWYGPYANGPQTNPDGATTGTNRVCRGGSWVHFAYYCRTAYRGYNTPTFADTELGFRAVLPQPPSATVTVSASPANGGTVSGGGIFEVGSTNTVTATANPGYQFVNWTETNGSVASASSNYTFTLGSNNEALVANFIPTYIISVIASPSAGGTVSGGGVFEVGSTNPVTATANPGYQFVNWTETNGSVASLSASYSFTLTNNQILVANFTAVSVNYIAVIASPSAGGTVNGGGTFVFGNTNTVTATANPGYQFVNWTETNGSVASLSASYSFMLTNNQILVANFTAMPVNYIAVIASPSAGGTVSGGGAFVLGSTNTVTATANPGYQFVNWTETNGSVASLSASYSFTLTNNQILAANYIPNLVVPVKGTYNGLFFNTTNGVTEQTAGMLKGLAISKKGTYSGTLLINGASHAISGSFDSFGQATNKIARTATGPLTVVMKLLISSNAAPQVTGTVSGTTNGVSWVATNLTADLATNLLPSAEYTMLFLPDTNNAPPTNSPGGDGYALITNKAGTATITGALADGTALSQTVPVSQDGYVPIYANLYSSKGLLLGWINLDLTNTNAVELNGLTWIHPARTTGLYQNGFTNVLLTNQILLSPWTNPPGNIVLLTNLAMFDAINDTNALTNIVVRTTAAGKVTGTSVNGTVNLKTGLLTVTIKEGKTSTTGHGAILLNATNGGGYFLTKTYAGAVILQP